MHTRTPHILEIYAHIWEHIHAYKMNRTKHELGVNACQMHTQYYIMYTKVMCSNNTHMYTQNMPVYTYVLYIQVHHWSMLYCVSI